MRLSISSAFNLLHKRCLNFNFGRGALEMHALKNDWCHVFRMPTTEPVVSPCTCLHTHMYICIHPLTHTYSHTHTHTHSLKHTHSLTQGVWCSTIRVVDDTVREGAG